MVNLQCHLIVPHEFDMIQTAPKVLIIKLIKQGPHVPHFTPF